MGKVVRNRSAKGHKFPRNRQQMMLSGFVYAKVRFKGKSECFGCSINPEVGEITVERFESLF